MSPRGSRRQPEFVIDRSLGSVIVPGALAAKGYIVHTLSSIYGEEAAQELDDEVWLRHAGERAGLFLQRMNAFGVAPASSPPLATLMSKRSTSPPEPRDGTRYSRRFTSSSKARSARLSIPFASRKEPAR